MKKFLISFWDQYKLLVLYPFFLALFCVFLNKSTIVICIVWLTFIWGFLIWHKIKTEREKKKFKEQFANQLSKNGFLIEILAEEYGKKTSEIETYGYGLPTIDSPLGYSLTTDFGEETHNFEFSFLCNSVQSADLEPMIASFIEEWNLRYAEQQITLEYDMAEEWYQKEYKKFLLDTVSVSINLFVPYNVGKEAYSKSLHELRQFVDSLSDKALHREYILSDGTHLIYRGKNLEEATNKGATLGKDKTNGVYDSLYVMVLKVRKKFFCHLKEFRDLPA